MREEGGDEGGYDAHQREPARHVTGLQTQRYGQQAARHNTSINVTIVIMPTSVNTRYVTGLPTRHRRQVQGDTGSCRLNLSVAVMTMVIIMTAGQHLVMLLRAAGVAGQRQRTSCRVLGAQILPSCL